MALQAVKSIKFGWFLMKPFLSKEIRVKILVLLALIIAMSLFAVYLSVVENKLNAAFYNAIQTYDQANFLHILIRLTSLLSAIVLSMLVSFYLESVLQISCRKWLTNFFVNKWFENKAYYQTRIQGQNIDNPDQRISQDIEEFISITLYLFLGAFQSIVSLFSFIVILWNLSGQFKFSIYHHTFAIPGYMVWVALLYSGVCTYITFLLGKSLTKLAYNKEKYEAGFRYNLMRVHEYSDHIASYNGEKSEKIIIQKSFDNVVDNFKATIFQQLKVNIFNYFYFRISSLFPTLISAGRYFAKEIALGNMMQINSAFASVQSSISFFIYSFSSIANLRAVIDRLYNFYNAIDISHSITAPSSTNIDTCYLEVGKLTIKLPHNKILLDNFSMKCESGDRILIVGRSSSGKTTLLRTLNGIWPFFEGVICKKQNLTSLFISQKAYMPNSNLKDALCYPYNGPTFSDEEVIEIMKECGLEKLSNQLYEVIDYSKILSVGELQKISFCRILINKPDLIYLDEATSALDEKTEQHLYQIIMEKLPKSVIISAGHRSTLQAFHNRIIDLIKGE